MKFEQIFDAAKAGAEFSLSGTAYSISRSSVRIDGLTVALLLGDTWGISVKLEPGNVVKRGEQICYLVPGNNIIIGATEDSADVVEEPEAGGLDLSACGDCELVTETLFEWLAYNPRDPDFMRKLFALEEQLKKDNEWLA